MATTNNTTEAAPREEGLTLATAKQIYSTATMSNDSGFELIRKYYHPNVRFRDAVQELYGRDTFIEMTQRFIKRCSQLDVRLNDAAQNGNVIFLQWTMDMRFGKAPLASIEGTTKLTLNAEGKVIEHRDYFDLWGDTFDSIPALGKLYRRAMKLMA